MKGLKNILLVEDVQAEASLVEAVLREVLKDSFQLVHCETLEDTLTAMQGTAFDVILLDLSLPDSFGLETYKEVDAYNKTAAIVALTGNDDEGRLADLIIEAGAQDFVSKNDWNADNVKRVFRYLAQRKRADLRLKRAVQSAVSANEAKSLFVANMSHELRTPLNSMLILADILRRENLAPEKVREYSEIISNGGKDLLKLINEILDMSKMESGNMEMDESEFLMYPFLQRLKAQFLPQCYSKDISFTLDYSESVPRLWRTDEQRLAQVLKNLLSNAVKFTESGRISLKVDAEELSANVYQLVFRVKDTGMGIAPENLKRVFDPFQQEHEGISRNFEGTGLGLTISRRLAEYLGGGVSVESVPGSGSEFTLRVLCRLEQKANTDFGGDPTPSNGEMVSSIAYEPVFHGRKILLVEDNCVNVFAMTSVFKQHGIEVSIAGDGYEALAFYEKNPDTDLILMDVMMPRMNGLEAMRQIRSIEASSGRPPVEIIALTANALVGDQDCCLKAGADDYIAKPVDIDSLVSKMADRIGLRMSNVIHLKKVVQ